MPKTCICSEPEHCDGSCYNKPESPSPSLPETEQGEKLFRWVKASERLPENNELKSIAALIDDEVEALRFYDGNFHIDTKMGWLPIVSAIERVFWLEEKPQALPVDEVPHVHLELKSGAVARVSPNASPELLNATETIVDLAKKMPDPHQPVPEEVMDADKNKAFIELVRDMRPEQALRVAAYIDQEILSLRTHLSSTEAERDAIKKAFDLQAEELKKLRNQ